MAIILHYFTKISTFGVRSNYVTVVKARPIVSVTKNVAQVIFDSIQFTMMFSQITEKKCIKDRYSTLSSKNSNCARLRSDVSNHRVLVLGT